jgi:hypothetical protein
MRKSLILTLHEKYPKNNESSRQPQQEHTTSHEPNSVHVQKPTWSLSYDFVNQWVGSGDHSPLMTRLTKKIFFQILTWTMLG